MLLQDLHSRPDLDSFMVEAGEAAEAGEVEELLVVEELVVALLFTTTPLPSSSFKATDEKRRAAFAAEEALESPTTERRFIFAFVAPILVLVVAGLVQLVKK